MPIRLCLVGSRLITKAVNVAPHCLLIRATEAESLSLNCVCQPAGGAKGNIRSSSFSDSSCETEFLSQNVLHEADFTI